MSDFEANITKPDDAKIVATRIVREGSGLGMTFREVCCG
jgi:hypothetical protein